MTPFEPGGPDIPAAPFEVPEAELPPSDFVAIGEQAGAGLVKSKLTDAFLKSIIDGMAAIVGAILAALVGLVEWVVAGLLKIVVRSLQANDSASNEIAATVVGGMTGRPVSASMFSNATDRGARSEIAINLVNDILAALQTGQGPGDGSGVQPSKAGAEQFLKLSTHMAIEGWLIGWVADAFSVHELEQLGSLKDGLERALGLGRLARRALAAPMKILVEDPFTYLLNSQYRPALPAVELLVRQYLRGIIGRPTLDKYMGYHGYQNIDVEALINFNILHLSPAEIETLKLHGDLDETTAKSLLKGQGYDEAGAASVLAALAFNRFDAWNKQRVQEALLGLTDRKLTRSEFDIVLDNSGLPADERDSIGKLADLKVQLSRKRFTLSEGEQLVKKGIWGLDQFRDLATQLGYTADDETDLELLLLLDIKDAADAAAKRRQTADAKAAAAKAKAAATAAKAANAAAAAEAKGIGVAKFEALVMDGLKTVPEYQTFLAGKAIAPDNITALVAALQAKLDKAAAAALARPDLAAGAKAKNLDLAQLEAGVKAGALTLDEFTVRLQQIGFSSEDTQLLASVLSDQLQAAKVKADAKTAAAGTAKARGADLAQIERGVRVGLLSLDDYSARLDKLGFNPEDRDLLVGEMQKQLDADKAARELKASVAAAAKAKGLNLAQLEAAVRAGVQTIDEYKQALAKAGYDAAAQAALVSLLQLRMSQDKETLAAKGRATALLATAGLSLADIERAVKLSVIPLAVYTDALKSSGLDPQDAQTLTLALAAQLKSVRAAKSTAASVAADLAQIGLNLTKLENDVLSGKLHIEQFQSTLAGAGVSDSDIAAIVGLVLDELANKQHVETLQGNVAATAAAKGLSLAQEEAAVRAGVKTLGDYSSFVLKLGYSQADAATLTETLASKLPAPSAAPVTPPPAVP